jgi:hypothetical protein
MRCARRSRVDAAKAQGRCDHGCVLAGAAGEVGDGPRHSMIVGSPNIMRTQVTANRHQLAGECDDVELGGL